MELNQSYTLGELARYSESTLLGDGECLIHSINTLQQAGKGQLSFLSNLSYQKFLSSTEAECVILHPSQQHLFKGNKIVTDNPYYIFAKLTQLFEPVKEVVHGIHPSVIIGDNSQVSATASIAANVVIGDNVIIDDGVHIAPGCYIGDRSIIGQNSILKPNVVIYSHVTLGQNVLVHSQAVIGADGFGFAPKNDGLGGWQKVYQLGGVTIGNDVEIGAGTSIDRGALDNTIIASGVKLDNQIQIAHNVEIGENTAIAGATAIAGSTVIGKRCTIAGAVGIIGHLTITDDVHITAMTLVTKSISRAGSYSSGTPINKTSVWRKNAARFNHLDQFVRKIEKQNIES